MKKNNKNFIWKLDIFSVCRYIHLRINSLKSQPPGRIKGKMSEIFQPEEVMLQLCDVLEKLRQNSLKTYEESEADLLMSLTARQQKALVAVSHLTQNHEEGISLKILAERINMTLPATSVLVESMVRNGVLVREASVNDRRAVCIKLSPIGKRLFQNICAQMKIFTRELFEDVPEQDKKVFARVVHHLHETIFRDSVPLTAPLRIK